MTREGLEPRGEQPRTRAASEFDADMIRRIRWNGAILWLGMLVYALAFGDASTFWGVLGGGSLALGNLWLLESIVTWGLTPREFFGRIPRTRRTPPSKTAVLALYFTKTLLLYGGVVVLVVWAPVNLVWFVTGLSLAVLAILWEALKLLKQTLY
jgi:hypothetical protein